MTASRGNASSNAPGAGLHQPRDLRPRKLQRWPEPEDNRCGERQRNAEEQNRHVHLDNRFRGKRIFRKPRGQQGESTPCEENTQRSAGGRNAQ